MPWGPRWREGVCFAASCRLASSTCSIGLPSGAATRLFQNRAERANQWACRGGLPRLCQHGGSGRALRQAEQAPQCAVVLLLCRRQAAAAACGSGLGAEAPHCREGQARGPHCGTIGEGGVDHLSVEGEQEAGGLQAQRCAAALAAAAAAKERKPTAGPQPSSAPANPQAGGGGGRKQGGLGVIPSPQSPVPNHQSPVPITGHRQSHP